MNIDSILHSWQQTFGRYELYLPHVATFNNPSAVRARLNHAMFWHPSKTTKVVVHSNSKKLISQTDLYASFYLALAVISSQSPKLIKSKQSISGFKMMQNTALGACVHLRHHKGVLFCYKWTFLSPNAAILTHGNASNALGVNNMFGFELDSLDYDAFETLPGCDILWHRKPG